MMKLSPQFKITLIYIVFSVLWIYFSDRFLMMLISDPQSLSRIQTAKAWTYVVVTALLLYSLIKRNYRSIEKKEAEKQKIFDTTIKAVYQIYNNFLNGMQSLKNEAEKSKDINTDLLNLTDRAIKEAQTRVKDLSAVTDITEAMIKKSDEMV